MSSRVLVALRVRASPEQAFAVFTGRIGDWWRPSPLFEFTPGERGVLAFEPGPQGRLIETLSGGQVFEVGRIRLWSPPERLTFSWRQASFAPDMETEVEVSFHAVGEEIRVTIEHRGWDSVPSAHDARQGFPDQIFLLHHGQWWRDQLGRLVTVAEHAGGGA